MSRFKVIVELCGVVHDTLYIRAKDARLAYLYARRQHYPDARFKLSEAVPA